MSTTLESRNKVKERIDELFSFIPGIENAAAVPVLNVDELEEAVFVDEWVANNQPCIIKDGVKHWPALEKWNSEEYLLANSKKFEVSVYPHRNYNVNERQNVGMEELSFHDAIKRLFQGTDEVFSIPSKNVDEHSALSELSKDVKGFSFLKNPKPARFYPGYRAFIYRNAGTAWHYHNVDETLLCQIVGSKTVALLPPTMEKADYVVNFLNSELQLDGEKLDPSIELNPMIVEVKAGDALYIPPYWYHAVVPADEVEGFTLSFCWASPWNVLGDFSNFFVRKLYKQALWPLNPFSPFLPFLGAFSFMKHKARNWRKKK